MNNKLDVTTTNKSLIGSIISWLFAIAVLTVGLINLFWGNDPFFGIFLILLSFIYMPPVNDFLNRRLSFAIPLIARIILAIFIIWASLGVGELFDKIDLMLMDFNA